MGTYRERLTVSWWLWPFVLGVAALLAAELGIGAVALRHPLTYVVVCSLAVAGLLALGRIQIRVERDGTGAGLRVDDTYLPLAVIADAVPLTAEEKRDLLGRDADPLAFVIQRPWIPRGVRIDLDDPDDPTPYWFISTRHPEKLAAALIEARVGSG